VECETSKICLKKAALNLILTVILCIFNGMKH